MTTPLPFRSVLFLLCAVVLHACTGQPDKAANRWANERLWPVLDAQDRRDTGALCDLLRNTSSEVRAAAALAFASVQDTAAIPCLLAVLTDSVVSVRANAIYALGFISNGTAAQQMADISANEQDSVVQLAYLNAAFYAMQRRGLLNDPSVIFFYLDRSVGQERVRAADALRRLPDSVLAGLDETYRTLLVTEQDPAVKAMLVRGVGAFSDPGVPPMLEGLVTQGASLSIRVTALRMLARVKGASSLPFLAEALSNPSPMMRRAALDALAGIENELDREQLGQARVAASDPMTYLPWFGLLRAPIEDGDATYLRNHSELEGQPYAYAELVSALAQVPEGATALDLSGLMKGDGPAIIRQAAFAALVRAERNRMSRSRYTSPEAQYAQLGALVRDAVSTNDAGLISAVLELLLLEDGPTIGLLFDKASEDGARASLHPVRDMEGLNMIIQVAAKRDGLPIPVYTPPAHNHPIDKERLRSLKQGQRYRITTAKGNIILATDVNDCPGSSLAFDSLVTAGYYNGKAFHRMVPNFVVQGGCPRGDGYGGMPWTLRTEIGRKPFTAGSVGLASAGRDTESCQFFITHSAAPHLDGRYTRFGEVVEGMDIVWQLQVGDVMERVERIL